MRDSQLLLFFTKVFHLATTCWCPDLRTCDLVCFLCFLLAVFLALNCIFLVLFIFIIFSSEIAETVLGWALSSPHLVFVIRHTTAYHHVYSVEVFRYPFSLSSANVDFVIIIIA